MISKGSFKVKKISKSCSKNDNCIKIDKAFLLCFVSIILKLIVYLFSNNVL